MKFNRKSFFTGYREVFGRLDQEQVEGLEFLLDKLEQDDFTIPQASYVLATVDHETAHTFQPIKEIRERKDSPRRANQDRYWLSGYYGRGYVQITWKKNYEKFGIEAYPDDALDPEMAYGILSRGMREGLFTGKKLSDYINDQKADYRNARRIVNGLDKADLIADRAQRFRAILSTSVDTAVEHVDTIIEPPKPEDPTQQEPEPPGAPQAPKPEVTPVSAPATSWTTKIAAGASAVAPVVAATGLKIGGVEFKTGGLVAISAIIIVGMVVAAWLYNESQKRRSQELQLSIANLASPDRENVIAAGSKV